jgi:hypothetical protein
LFDDHPIERFVFIGDASFGALRIDGAGVMIDKNSALLTIEELERVEAVRDEVHILARGRVDPWAIIPCGEVWNVPIATAAARHVVERHRASHDGASGS